MVDYGCGALLTFNSSLEEKIAGSINNLTSDDNLYRGSGPQIYDPYPDYNDESYKHTYAGNYVPCVGPRGLRLDESSEDEVLAYVGSPKGLFESSNRP